MFKWRVSLRWYAGALLIFPVLILAVLVSLSVVSSMDYSPNFIAFGIVGGLMAGIIEETGWTGYAYPKMKSRFGTPRATLYLALLHGIWHAVPGILGDGLAYGEYWLPRFIVMWMVAMVAMRIILVWVYSNTGSLLLAQLTHASSTGFLIMFGPSISPANETYWWAIYAVVLWIAAAVVIARYGKDFVKLPRRIQVARSSAD
jgi:membrane protease YdiL (CAAX protease family)